MVRIIVSVVAVAAFFVFAYLSVSSIQPSFHKDPKGHTVIKGAGIWKEMSYRITQQKGKPNIWYVKTAYGYGQTDENKEDERYLQRFKNHVEKTGGIEAVIHILTVFYALGGFLAFLYRRSIKPNSMVLFKKGIGVALVITFCFFSMAIINMNERAENIFSDVFDHEPHRN